VKKNMFFDRHDIFDGDGKQEGYIKKNMFLKNRCDVYDQDGRHKG
jgi:hypothetical protein